MNAYKFFELEIPTILPEDTEGIMDMDELVKERLNAKYQELIRKLNEILDNKNIPSEEEVKKAKDIWLEYLRAKRAYAHIKSDQTRKQYASNAQDVDKEGKIIFEDAQQRPTILTKNKRNNSAKAQNAYSVLGICPIAEVTDREMLRKLDQFLKFSVSKTVPKKLPECENMLRQAMKYVWAYTQLATEQDRNVYTYKLAIMQKADEINLACKTVRIGGVYKLPQLDQQTLRADGGDKETITITKMAKVDFGTFIIKNESTVNYYDVVIKNKTGNIGYGIYGDIDYERIESDPQYALTLKKKILTPEVMEFAEENLGRYVGEINQDGKVEIDPEKAAACLSIKRILDSKYKGEEKKGEVSKSAASRNLLPEGQAPGEDDGNR